MDRHQPHGLIVAFQPELVLFDDAVRRPNLFCQPTSERSGAETMLLRRRMECLGQVQQVREAPLPVLKLQEAPAHLPEVQPVAEHRQETQFEPALVVLARGLPPGLPCGFIAGHRVEFRAAQAHQVGHKRGAQSPFVGRLGQSGQHALQFAGFARSKDAFLRVQHAGHARSPQRPLHQCRLSVFLHEHGDVARREPARAERCAAVEEPDNLRGHDAGKLLLRELLADFLLVRLARQKPELQSWRLHPVFPKWQFIGLAGGIDFLKSNLIEREWIRRAAEQRVDGANEAGLRAPVPVERITVLRGPRRVEIGEDVRAAKAVDGLLWIADEEQGWTGDSWKYGLLDF